MWRWEQTRYNKWYEYASGTPSVRGDGRLKRRERRRERKHAQELTDAVTAVTDPQVT